MENSASLETPRKTNVAFKEWAVVCDALASGRENIIIRKGGIAEGRNGFSFQHDEFFLFPTWFHEQVAKTILPPETQLPPQPEEVIEISLAAKLEWSHLITDWEKLMALRDFHILSESAIEERYHYDDFKGVYVAFVRVFRLSPIAKIQNEKKYGGCRSWVNLPEITSDLIPVINEEEHLQRRAAIEEILGIPAR